MNNATNATKTAPALMYLGDFLAGLRHFGSCPDCGSQHASQADRGRPHPAAPHMFQCAKCATKS